jgi:hypothetical protein
MASFYSVVQYLPDPIADERINVGVVVFGGGDVRSRFLRDWHRVRLFRGGDIGFLREFADQFSQKQEVIDVTGVRPRINEERVRAMAGRWTNCIQLSEPRASLLAPDALLDDVSLRFLRERHAGARGFRDRRAAARLAEEMLRVELEDKLGDPGRGMTRRNQKVRGRAGDYEFDLVVARGSRVFMAVVAISFELGDLPEIERQVHAAAWELDDVHRHNKTTRRALVALPPQRPAMQNVFKKARAICGELKAEFVPEDALAPWAKRAVSQVRRVAA